jgi:hypothetical protein
VSKDGGLSAGLVHQHGAATILGSPSGNTSSGTYGYVSDWAVDMGSGFGAECNVSLSPDCVSTGVHVLSLPRGSYFGDCCTLMLPALADRPRPHREGNAEAAGNAEAGNAEAGMVEAAVAAAAAAAATAAWREHLPEFPHPPPPPRSWQSLSASRIPSMADLIMEAPARACGLLEDMVAGALPLVRGLEVYSSCGEEDEEPVVSVLLSKGFAGKGGGAAMTRGSRRGAGCCGGTGELSMDARYFADAEEEEGKCSAGARGAISMGKGEVVCVCAWSFGA